MLFFLEVVLEEEVNGGGVDVEWINLLLTLMVLLLMVVFFFFDILLPDDVDADIEDIKSAAVAVVTEAVAFFFMISDVVGRPSSCRFPFVLVFMFVFVLMPAGPHALILVEAMILLSLRTSLSLLLVIALIISFF